jgi:hypothetical protein
MNLRKHVTPKNVEILRDRLFVAVDDMPMDAYAHEIAQIEQCLLFFIDIVERVADTDDGSLTDSLMLASISERVIALANVIVTKEAFDAKLDALTTKVTGVVDSNTALIKIIETLVTDYKTVLSQIASDPTTQLDFSVEAAKLDSLSAQADSISSSNATVSSDVNAAITSVGTTVSAAPPSTVPAPAGGTASSTGIVNQTPAPVNQQAPGTASSTAGTTPDPLTHGAGPATV